MNIYRWLIVVAWIVFLLYWTISACGRKKMIRVTNPSWRFLGLGLVIVFFISFSQFPFFAQKIFVPSWLQLIGVILCWGGIVFAIWARRNLGRNWSSTPSIQEDHELVTSGPYRFVRHPIYTGITTAIFGALIVNAALPWLIFFVLLFAMFIWRIGVEEKFMIELFGQIYLDYRKRTKALIPFIW